MSEITVRVRASSTYGIDFPGSHRVANCWITSGCPADAKAHSHHISRRITHWSGYCLTNPCRESRML
jgi:hypothetical protein